MTSRDFWKNNGNNDMQCGYFNMTRAEDGKLLSHLEWPYLLFIRSYYHKSSHILLFVNRPRRDTILICLNSHEPQGN